jgi:hypothetical protein
MHATKKRPILSFITSDTRASQLVPTQSHVTEFRFASRRSIAMLSAQLCLAVTVSSSQIFRLKFCVRFTFFGTSPQPIISLIIRDRGHTVRLLLTDFPCGTQLYSCNRVYINSPLLGCESKWYSQWSRNCTS